LAGRTRADQLAKEHSLAWSEADMWRLTKFCKHNLPAYAPQAIATAAANLGHAPVSWEEMYQSVIGDATGLQKKALNNATATGVLNGASGTMTSGSDKVPFTAGAARQAPPTANAATTRQDPPAATPPAPEMSPTQAAYVSANAQDVYH